MVTLPYSAASSRARSAVRGKRGVRARRRPQRTRTDTVADNERARRRSCRGAGCRGARLSEADPAPALQTLVRFGTNGGRRSAARGRGANPFPCRIACPQAVSGWPHRPASCGNGGRIAQAKGAGTSSRLAAPARLPSAPAPSSCTTHLPLLLPPRGLTAGSRDRSTPHCATELPSAAVAPWTPRSSRGVAGWEGSALMTAWIGRRPGRRGESGALRAAG